ncbi:ABC-type glycerol-3-phosphate transport system substrate-binding protein [Arthrobacter ginsengisoli]|uniref:ABC-type glycerol-3-phosphate transport system substrate-binding protein n=1 Tax=Arthrobacter ginsengisoli TaxID=1356565 RepID=A0ABU1UCM0_9MICC|nr:hypothetical protein [Arthrobacter ginsengisoli]MDR7082949.1 ABC-type glycerol-3-phosphate transport system substrate-binding protein [Arthrobacter ginsengisoli]
MKKTLTVLIAAGALLGAAGCSAPQDTTAETCARVQTVGAGPTSNADQAGMIRLANRLRPIQAAASEELKAPLHSIIDFLDESAKETPDSAKLQELQGSYTEAGQALSAACSGGQ